MQIQLTCKKWHRLVFWVAATLFASGPDRVAGQSADFELSPILYNEAPVDDAVARLGKLLREPDTALAWDEEHGYLPAVLEALDVPVTSQVLVFSKTSLQLHRITPRRPRAVYFNDDVYVGWCQNGDVIELAATDASQGAVFYTLAQRPERSAEIIRDRGQCITCHASSRTQNVPGYLVRSVFARRDGQPEYGSGTFLTDHTSDFADRWGGWYVSGTHGDMRHMGNEVCEIGGREAELDREAGANRTSLDDLFPVDKYLTPHSDLVALMVLAQQTQMHNALTAANFETRRAIHQSTQMNELLERPQGQLSEIATRRIERAAENVVEHLLMCGEFELQDAIEGTSGFAEEFQRRGVRDSKDRSLFDFDLTTRLFKYPCSHLVYTPAFDALPDEVRRRVIERTLRVLRGEDNSETFAHLSSADRRAILEILEETKPEFAGR